MKGVAAFITFLIISYIYIGPEGYERYIKRAGLALYDGALVLKKVPGELEKLKKKAEIYQVKKAREQASSTPTSLDEMFEAR